MNRQIVYDCDNCRHIVDRSRYPSRPNQSTMLNRVRRSQSDTTTDVANDDVAAAVDRNYSLSSTAVVVAAAVMGEEMDDRELVVAVDAFVD